MSDVDIPWPKGSDPDDWDGGHKYYARRARWGDDIAGARPDDFNDVTIFKITSRRARLIPVDSNENVTPGHWENSDAWCLAAWEFSIDYWCEKHERFRYGYKVTHDQFETLKRLQIGYANGTHDWHGNPLPQARGPCRSQPTDYRFRQRALTALAGCADELARTKQGSRNGKLNTLAYRLGKMAARGWLTEDEIGSGLWAACEINGLVGDDGQAACRRTFQSGFGAGLLRPALDPIDRYPVDPEFAQRIKLKVSA